MRTLTFFFALFLAGCSIEISSPGTTPASNYIYDSNGPHGIWAGNIGTDYYTGIIENDGTANEYKLFLVSTAYDGGFIDSTVNYFTGTINLSGSTLTGVIQKWIDGASHGFFNFTTTVSPQVSIIGKVNSDDIYLAYQATYDLTNILPVENLYGYYLESDLPVEGTINNTDTNNYHGISRALVVISYRKFCYYHGNITKLSSHNIYKVENTFTRDYWDSGECPDGITHTGFSYQFNNNFYTFTMGTDGKPHYYVLDYCEGGTCTLDWSHI